MTVQGGAGRFLSARPIAAAAGGDLFWRRLRRDRVAVASAVFIVFGACFALEPLFEYLLGQGLSLQTHIFPFDG